MPQKHTFVQTNLRSISVFVAVLDVKGLTFIVAKFVLVMYQSGILQFKSMDYYIPMLMG